MPTQVQVRKGGAWKPTIMSDSPSGISVYKNGVWKPVLACYAYQAGKWKLVYNLGLPSPPVTAHGYNLPNNSAVQLTWSPVLSVDGGPAKDYVIWRSVGTWASGKFTPTPGSTIASSGFLTNTLSYTWGGLAQDTTYQFQVFWRNSVGTLSTGSNTIVASTGHAAFTEENPDYPSTTQYVLKAHRSNSWNDSGGWGAPYGDWGSVTQGNKTSGNTNNSYGCVDYSTLYEQVQDKIHTARYATNAQKNAAGDLVSTHTTVTRAAIRQVYRTLDGGGGSGIPVRFTRGTCDFTRDKQPDEGAVHLRFDAPAQNAPKGDDNGFNILDSDGTADADNTFESWVQSWIRHEDPTVNALIVHTQDGTGNDANGYNKFCNFRAVDVDGTVNWRVVVNLKWSIQTITAVAPVWNKQD